MPIPVDTLRAEARTVVKTQTLVEARTLRFRTAFLCHSHYDQDLAEGLVKMFARRNVQLYVDWKDTAMPLTPDRVTARNIQAKIREMDVFLFLATAHSIVSRWCPWEIGYADHAKSMRKVLIVPTEESGKWYGNEYLQLYPKLDLIANQFRAFDVASTIGQPVEAFVQ